MASKPNARVPTPREANVIPDQATPAPLGDKQSPVRQERKRSKIVAWDNPQPDPPKYIISDAFAPSLDENLDYLARAMFTFDFEFFKRLYKVDQKHILSPDSSKVNETRARITAYMDLKKQWDSIGICASGFAGRYLTDKSFIPVWSEAMKHIKKMFQSKKNSAIEKNTRRQYRKILKDYEPLAAALEKALISATSEGSLSKEIENLIRARWLLLDDVLSWYFKNHGSEFEEGPVPTRNIASWDLILTKIREAEKTSHEPSTTGTIDQDTLHLVRDPVSDVMTIHPNVSSPVLLSYVIFLCGAILSMAMFAVGYARSTHEKGSVHDADFWFTAQASITQVTCLISSIFLTCSSGEALTWRRSLLPIIAGICTLSVAPIYIVLPKEWSLFSASVATMLQSVLILQQFLFSFKVAKEKNQRDKKVK